MSYIKTNWVNNETELNAENMNHIENGVEQSYGQLLLAVDSTAPSECETGDKYYNTETDKIYTATGTDTWGTTGVDAELGVFYIVLESQNIYTYNGETLVSVGGGAGGGDSAPIGQVSMYAGSTAPDGFLMCDGSAVSRETYKDLYRVIGTTYGTGDGSTTFNLPNIKGKVVVMLDSNDTDFDTLGETGGEKTHKLTINEMPKHSHTPNSNSALMAGSNNYDISQTSGSRGYEILVIGETGGDQPHNNLQPYIVLNYIIKVQKLAGEVLSEQLPVGTEVDFDGSASDIPIGWEQVNGLEYCVATTTGATQTISSNYYVNLNQIARSNGNFTLSNGGIKIGSGIHHVRVSGAVFINEWSGGTYYLWARIWSGGVTISSAIFGSPSSYVTGAVPTTIVTVQENDVIKLMADSGAGGTVRNGSENTWLCIEKID